MDLYRRQADYKKLFKKYSNEKRSDFIKNNAKFVSTILTSKKYDLNDKGYTWINKKLPSPEFTKTKNTARLNPWILATIHDVEGHSESFVREIVPFTTDAFSIFLIAKTPDKYTHSRDNKIELLSNLTIRDLSVGILFRDDKFDVGQNDLSNDQLFKDFQVSSRNGKTLISGPISKQFEILGRAEKRQGVTFKICSEKTQNDVKGILKQFRKIIFTQRYIVFENLPHVHNVSMYFWRN